MTLPEESIHSRRHNRWSSVLSRVLTAGVLLGAAATVKTQPPTETPLMAEAPGGGMGIPGSGGDGEEEEGEYKLANLRVLNRAVLHIKEQYVDPQRVVPKDMLLASLDALEKQVPEVLVDEAGAPDSVTITVGTERKEFDIKKVDSPWEMSFKLRDIFRFVEPRLSPDVEKKDVEYAVINGMLNTLDPHTVLLPPVSYEEMKMSTSGEFGGLGIVIGLRDGALTIISPMDGTPASEVGLQAKDNITKINDESTVNMALDEAVKRLRGKAGTTVTVWVLRKGWTEPKRFDIKRAIIKIINVTHHLMKDGVGWVKVKNFQQDTATDVQGAIRSMRAEAGGSLNGLVLDLRNNPGGLLEQAVDLSDLFLDKGVIVTTVGEGDRMREEKSARWPGTERDLPVVVLVNGGSASASEIVAGALKNNDRALVVGLTTFGKGSVQTLLNFKDQSALKLTIAQYLTPGDVSIQNVGITPDVELAPMLLGADGDVDLFPDTHHTREADLDKHLDDKRIKQEKPSLTVRHMEEPPDPDSEETRDMSNKFKSDFEIEFARAVVLAGGAGGKTRPALLKAAQGVANKRLPEEEQKVFEKLKPLGVDWTAAPPLAGGAAKLTARVVGQPSANAGDILSITAEVTNEGPDTVFRVRANTESDFGMFVDREFLFGKLAPGEKKTWTAKIKIPKDLQSRSDDVKLVFSEANDRVPAPLTVRTTVKELPRPHFRYTAVLDDSAGNGDGRVSAGETVDLVVAVTNDGPGVADEPLVLAKNLGGRELFIKTGRGKLEKLAAGQTGVARLQFEAQHDVKRQLELRLTVLDSALAEYSSRKLVFPVLDGQSVAKGSRVGGTATVDQALLTAPDKDSAVLARVKKGTKLAADRMHGEFVRVELGEGLFGFARLSGVKLGAAKDAPKGAPSGVTLEKGFASPSLTITTPAGGLATAADSVSLSAEARHAQGIKDAMVFVNDQKIIYRPFVTARGESPDVAQKFDATVPLKKGTNLVTVIVRVDNEVATRQTLVIHRELEPETAARLEGAKDSVAR